MIKEMKIGIFGSAGGDYKLILKKARELGKALSKYNCIVITGAAGGLPNEVATVAHKNGIKIWGFSPSSDAKNQKKSIPDAELSIYAKILYTPKDFTNKHADMTCKKYRNVISTDACDAGLIISGRWGTMNEFTNLFDMGKVIGVLTGTGGIADELPNLCKKISKKSNSVVFFNTSPTKLLKMVMDELNKRNKSL